MNNRSIQNQLQELFGKASSEWSDVQYWYNPERTGWLWKKGQHLPNWRRRWFVMKQGRIYWFKSSIVTQESVPRGMIEIAKCLSIKGAENVHFMDVGQHAFELTTDSVDNSTTHIYLIAESEDQKEDWINAVGRAIVQHSKSMMLEEHTDYTTS